MESTGNGRGLIPNGRNIDFLGYCFDGDNVRLRKSIKQRFARKCKRLKSKKKRQQMLASYWGWCEWGNCRNLWNVITDNDMSFKDVGIVQRSRTMPDGKRLFDVPTIKMMDLLNVPITVLDFETGIKTREGKDRYAVLFEKADGTKNKFITNSFNIKDILDQARQAEQEGKKIFPVHNVVIKRKPLSDGKHGYYFDE